MSTTITRVEDIPELGRAEAMRLAEVEYGRYVDMLRTLSDDDWTKPTDCDRWNVGEITSHLIAMSEAFAGFPREVFRQQKASKPRREQLGLSSFDAWTEHQAKLHPVGRGLIERYEAVWPSALAKRRSIRVARLLRQPFPPYGWMTMANLLDEILTRDVWMHRVDVSVATGRDMVLTPEHDGRFVASIVRELGRRWKRAFALELTGAAGGRYVNGGSDAEPVRVDAVEFCRILSGRSTGHGLPSDVVPF